MPHNDEPKIAKPPATLLVIFGASGDLTSRKLIPALCNLAEDNYLPDDFIVIGSSRSPLSDEEFRAKVYEGIKQHSRRPISAQVWEKFWVTSRRSSSA
jgi:glucose-6-phosphate 1-dehydrogenase